MDAAAELVRMSYEDALLSLDVYDVIVASRCETFTRWIAVLRKTATELSATPSACKAVNAYVDRIDTVFIAYKNVRATWERIPINTRPVWEVGCIMKKLVNPGTDFFNSLLMVESAQIALETECDKTIRVLTLAQKN